MFLNQSRIRWKCFFSNHITPKDSLDRSNATKKGGNENNIVFILDIIHIFLIKVNNV